jgi:hypothetical protein
MAELGFGSAGRRENYVKGRKMKCESAKAQVDATESYLRNFFILVF